MMTRQNSPAAFWGCAAGLFILAARTAGAADDAPITREQFLLIQSQNQQLQQQLQAQQKLIDSLTHKVEGIEESNAHRDQAISKNPTSADDAAAMAPSSTLHIGNVNISGEGGVAFFS